MKKYIFLFLPISAIIVLYLIGSQLIQRENHTVSTNTYGGKAIELISRGKKISTILFQGEDDFPIIALFHPLGGSKESMIPHAHFLHSNGYSIMISDFIAHGNSEGEYKTFGYRESDNVQVIYTYLKKHFPKKKIGALGISLGGASVLLSKVKFDAILIEETYAEIETAIQNRLSMQLGEWAKSFSPLLTMQLPWRIGVDKEYLKPSKAIRTVDKPIFIIGGEKDKRATLAETHRLYNNIPTGVYKQLWIVKNAPHTNLLSFAKKEYKEKVLKFFNRTLGMRNSHF